ncbi:hypothetical protein BC829DRAFT_298447 [Chytridium lagenaria]|nr:hypothetical protein BC829DRAFT_298447 [Chytridium lagenaria]
MVIAELTENLSIGGNFFTEGNIVETTKMIFSVLTKASSRRDMDGSIELLEQLCKSDSLKEVINRYLKSSKPIKAALKSLSAEGSTQDQGFRLFTVLLKNRLCEEQLLPLISDTILLSDAAAWLETVVSSSQSLGQQYIDCEHAIQVVVAIMNSGLLKKLEKSKKSLTEHIYKFSSSLLKSLESLLSSDDILSKLGYLLSFAVEVAEALSTYMQISHNFSYLLFFPE